MGTVRTDEFRKDAVGIVLTSELSRRQVGVIPPLLLTSSAVLAFGVAVSVVARLDAEGQASPQGLAERKAPFHEALIRVIEQGDAKTTSAPMNTLIETDP